MWVTVGLEVCMLGQLYVGHGGFRGVYAGAVVCGSRWV